MSTRMMETLDERRWRENARRARTDPVARRAAQERSTEGVTAIPASARRAGPWIGRVLSGLAVAFLAFDGVIKLTALAPVAESWERLGYPAGVGPAIGIVELLCVCIYTIPRFSMVGAVLLTGYLGGAIASHVRVSDPLLSHVLFPTYVAALIWGGLFLRDARLSAIVSGRGRHPAAAPQGA